MLYDMIYLLNCSWVATRWQQYSTRLHTNNTQDETKETILVRTTQEFWKFSADRVPSLRVIPCDLTYNWGKNTEKTSVRVAEECQLARWKYINIQY
jgi:hypothetical protein